MSDFGKILGVCQIKNKVKDKEVNDFKGTFLKSPSEAILCMYKCFLEDGKLITSDGQWHLENWLQFVNLLKLTPIEQGLISCSKITKEIKTCDALEEMRKCLELTMSVELT